MEEHRAKAERLLQSLIDQGVVTKVTWAAGGYGSGPHDGVIRVLVAGDIGEHESTISAKLSGIGAPFRIASTRA